MLASPELLHESALPHPLGQSLPRWLREVPIYQVNSAASQFTRHFALEEFQRLPFITKQDLRRNFPHNFLRPGAELAELLDAELVELEHTSGTSGERIPLLMGNGWWSEQEASALRLNSTVLSVFAEFPQARRVTITSPACSGDICYTGVPSSEERTLGNSLFVSLSRFPFLWSERDLGRIAEETLAWEPKFLDVDPVYGVVFALYCERRAIQIPSLRFVLCSYEFCSVVHRRILERVFGVPVFDLYGSTETGHLLMETSNGEMLPSSRTAYLEILKPDEDGIGELVVTTLTNEFMPLIRYRIGDLVERREVRARTSYRLHGRLADSFEMADGQRVTTRQVDECFVDVTGIAHYQLLERPGKSWLLRFVPDASPFEADHQRAAQDRLVARIGSPAEVDFESTDLLMPESSGKFRLSIGV